MRTAALLRELWVFAKPHKKWLVLSVITAAIISMADIAWAILIKMMIDHSLAGDMEKLQKTIGMVAGLLVIGVIAKYAVEYATASFGTLTMRDLRNRLLNHIAGLPVHTLESGHSGEVISRMTNDAASVQQFLMSNVFPMVWLPLTFAMSASYLAYTNVKLMLIVFLPVPLAIFMVRKISASIRKYSSKHLAYLSEVNSRVQDTVAGIHVVKAFNLEKPLMHRVDDAIGKAMQQEFKSARQIAFTVPFQVMLRQLPNLLSIIYGGYMAIHGYMDVTALIIFLRLIAYMVNPALSLVNLFPIVNQAMGAAARLIELLHIPQEREDGTRSGLPQLEASRQPVVEAKQLRFGYNETSDVIQGIDVKMPQGQMVALVGSSGCGKSTLLNLICGFYPYSSGSLKIFGRELKEWHLPTLRNYISIVSQDSFLFPGTLEENIRYGRMDATTEEIIEASKAAQAHRFIEAFPDGYQTVVGERGARLSGGQRQRISIARAILKNAPLLLLDEPTSALDLESEAAVKTALDHVMQDRTVIVIAHRLSTIQNADQIYVMDQGKIVDHGTHEQLLSKPGLYQQLYRNQFDEAEQEEDQSRAGTIRTGMMEPC